MALRARRWLRRRSLAQGYVAQVVVIALGQREDRHDHVLPAGQIAVGVETVVVSDRPAAGQSVQAVPEAIGILVVAGTRQSLRRYVNVVVCRRLEPRDRGDVTPAGLKPDQQLLLPAALPEWLSDDHLAYFISDVVDQWWTSWTCRRSPRVTRGKGVAGHPIIP